MNEDQQPHEAAVHALAATQQHAQAVLEACQRLACRLEAMNTPAIPETVALTALEPIKRLEARDRALSIGVINPSPVQVYLGYGGGKATAEARAWPIAAASALILPVSIEDAELGADAADLEDGDAVIYVLRFAAVQPFSVGSL